ncbi:serine hydrolase domain-containing protein [Steroidobacter sp.]|uniref:serine hydrolase domain-containing protein n=1 Tax=Steroidobacter sp. TaxID=1978227 RepID=UPI0025F2BA5C|nr:serine hydrolase domain-containing protein [Steroidobacter sp.]
MTLRIASSVVLAACLATSAGAADRFDGVREYIRTQLVEKSVPSIAVAVAKDGKIIWEEGFGWADRERRIPATEHTSYSLASVSKPITTTGIMTLVQAGKIDLDAPANDYLGGAKLLARVGDARAATVRRLANHTSGLPLHFQDYFADDQVQRPAMDLTILRYGNLVRAPGERTQYSNIGFGVLDYIIERVSGMSYEEYMRREVFVPLGMTRSSVGIGPGLEDFAAARYNRLGEPLPVMDSDSRGAGGVFASAHDLVRFGLFHLKTHLPEQKAILSDASVDEMHRRTADRNVYGLPNPEEGFGVGFALDQNEQYPIIQHDGGMDGVATKLQLFPKQRVAIVVLSNASTQLPADVADRIVSVMLPGRKVKTAPVTPAPAFAIPANLAGTWKGIIATYERDLPVELRFLANGSVQMKVVDQLPALIDRPTLNKGIFTGWAPARIETPDTQRYAYTLWLDLSVRGDVINGAVTAHTDRRAPRMGSALTHWMEVRRDSPDVPAASAP